MHGTQADARLLGEFALRDVRVFMDQVHDPKVGIGVLCLVCRIHFNSRFGTLPPYRVHDSIENLTFRPLFNIEHLNSNLKLTLKQHI